MTRRARAIGMGLMFEHRTQPLLPMREFLRRMAWSGALAGGMVSMCLAIGILGYHGLGKLEWLDAMVNASMILGGMGPVDPIHTVSGKVFESAYALFSGVAFITSIGIFLSPAVHRLLHVLHLEAETGGDD